MVDVLGCQREVVVGETWSEDEAEVESLSYCATRILVLKLDLINCFEFIAFIVTHTQLTSIFVMRI